MELKGRISDKDFEKLLFDFFFREMTNHKTEWKSSEVFLSCKGLMYPKCENVFKTFTNYVKVKTTFIGFTQKQLNNLLRINRLKNLHSETGKICPLNELDFSETNTQVLIPFFYSKHEKLPDKVNTVYFKKVKDISYELSLPF